LDKEKFFKRIKLNENILNENFKIKDFQNTLLVFNNIDRIKKTNILKKIKDIIIITNILNVIHEHQLF
jgi:hypothetical protein